MYEKYQTCLWLLCCGCFLTGPKAFGSAEEKAITPVKLTLEPTFESMGVILKYQGDSNFNAGAAIQYRAADEKNWRTGHPFARISDGQMYKDIAMNKDGSGGVNPRFATSLFYLQEGTQYEVRAVLTDPDGVTQQLPSQKAQTKNSKVPAGGGKHFYVDAAVPAGGDGSKEKPFKSAAKGFQVGGPGDTVHFKKGVYHFKGTTQCKQSGSEKAWLHYQAEPGAVFTDADPEVSGVGALKWEKFKQDVDKRWIYKTGQLKDVTQIMVRKKANDPSSAYFLWRFYPKARGPHRGQTLQHMIDDIPNMNEFGAFTQEADGVYLTLPKGIQDPAQADFQISRGRNDIWLWGHHVLFEGFTFELKAGFFAQDHKGTKGHHLIYRRLQHFGSQLYSFRAGEHALVEDSRFVFNAHWDWLQSKPARNGKFAWSKIKNGVNDTSMLQCGSHSVLRYNLVKGHSNSFPITRAHRNVDVHNNLIIHAGDDAIEPDNAFINGRVYHNKLFQIFNGFSDAPVFTGPAFVFRNIIYGYQQAAVKVRNYAPGTTFYYHNTCYPNLKSVSAYSSGEDGQFCFAPDRQGVRWMTTRNNIFIGRRRAYHVVGPPYLPKHKGDTLSFDYNCLWSLNGEKDRRFGDPHAIRVLPEFQDLKTGDLRLQKKDQPVVDAGIPIKGINDEVPAPYQFQGKAPDIGVYEWGMSKLQFGPRTKPSLATR